MVPDALILDRRVTPISVRLWMALDRYAGQDGAPMPAMSQIAMEIGCSPAVASRAFAELISVGWITGRPGDYNLEDEVAP